MPIQPRGAHKCDSIASKNALTFGSSSRRARIASVTGRPVALSSEWLPTVRAMLQNLSEQVRLCYERAAEAKERADETHDPEAKADFLNMERRWLLLARSYEFGERLDDFTRENSLRAKVARAFEPRAMLQASDTTVFGKDQNSRMSTNAPLLDADGQIVGIVGVGKDITERRKREEETEILLNELRHRLKNSLSLVQAIARQTIKPGDGLERFEHRLIAYARSQELVLSRCGRTLTLRDLVDAHRLAFDMASRVNVHGADVPLTPDWAIQIGIAIHELATNSIKHGALCNGGHVAIIWTVENIGEEKRNLVFIWDEIHSGSETKPGHPGFGHNVLTEIVPAQLNGIASLELEAGALRWTLQAALTDDDRPRMSSTVVSARDSPGAPALLRLDCKHRVRDF